MNVPTVLCNLCRGMISVRTDPGMWLSGGHSLHLKDRMFHRNGFQWGGDPEADMHLCDSCIEGLARTLPRQILSSEVQGG